MSSQRSQSFQKKSSATPARILASLILRVANSKASMVDDQSNQDDKMNTRNTPSNTFADHLTYRLSCKGNDKILSLENGNYEQTLQEYYHLVTRTNLSEIEAKRLERILEAAQSDDVLSLLINEIDELSFQQLGFFNEDATVHPNSESIAAVSQDTQTQSGTTSFSSTKEYLKMKQEPSWIAVACLVSATVSGFFAGGLCWGKGQANSNSAMLFQRKGLSSVQLPNIPGTEKLNPWHRKDNQIVAPAAPNWKVAANPITSSKKYTLTVPPNTSAQKSTELVELNSLAATRSNSSATQIALWTFDLPQSIHNDSFEHSTKVDAGSSSWTTQYYVRWTACLPNNSVAIWITPAKESSLWPIQNGKSQEYTFKIVC
jgi:hypothetical protein